MKLTYTQKKFRKDMEDLKNQGYTFENPRSRTVTFTDKIYRYRKFSIIGVLILLWNSFALYTWVATFFRGSSISPETRGVVSYTPTTYLKDSTEIKSYLEKSKDLDYYLTEKLNTLLMYLQDRNSYSVMHVTFLLDDFEETWKSFLVQQGKYRRK